MRLLDHRLLVACVIAACLLGGRLSAAVDSHGLPDFEIRDYAIITLKTGVQVVGTINKIDEYGTIEFVEPTGKRTFYQKREYHHYYQPRSLEQAVAERSEWLLANEHPDWSLEVRRTIDKAMEKGLESEARDLAVAATAKQPDDLLLGEQTIDLLEGHREHLDTLIAIAERGLKQNDKWLPGYQAKAAALDLQGKDDELYLWITEHWLPRSATNATANRYLARLAEKRGETEQAMEAYRKLWLFHQDPKSGHGFARMALQSGNLEGAAKTARGLIEQGAEVADAEAILGSVALAQNDSDTAEDLLQRSVDRLEALSPDVAAAAQYNLGVLRYRQGQEQEALKHWRGLELPAAKLARAIAKRQPVGDPDALPEPLATLAHEHNICLDLSRNKPERARDRLRKDVARHTFLGQVADLLESHGSEESIRALELTNSRESIHWQIYGHLIANRMDEVQALLDRLPEDDGYAAAVRVFVAADQGDMDRARRLYLAMTQVPDAPREYANTLAAEFAAEDDRLHAVDFADWTDGTNLRTGWSSANDGTGIRVGIEDGRLVLAGEQREPLTVTRVWMLNRADAVRRVEAVVDIAGLESASAGLEILDEGRQNGVAYGVLPDGRLGFRQLTQGSWSGWNALQESADGSTLELVVDVDTRTSRLVAELPSGRKRGIGRGVTLATDRICVGFFGMAETGVTWRLAASSMTVHLRARDGDGPRAR